MDLDKILNMENKIDAFLAYQNANRGLPVLLYGAGAGLFWYTAFAASFGIPVECIVDKKQPAGTQGSFEGIAVRNTADVFNQFAEALVIISAPKYRKEITREILSARPSYHVFAFDPTLSIQQDVRTDERRDFYRRNSDKLMRLHDCLADAFSAKTLEHILMGAVTSDCDQYAETASDSQYFPDIVRSRLMPPQKRYSWISGHTRAIPYTNARKRCMTALPDIMLLNRIRTIMPLCTETSQMIRESS